MVFQQLAIPVAQVSFFPLKNIKALILVKIYWKLQLCLTNRCDRMLLTRGNFIYCNWTNAFSLLRGRFLVEQTFSNRYRVYNGNVPISRCNRSKNLWGRLYDDDEVVLATWYFGALKQSATADLMKRRGKLRSFWPECVCTCALETS